MELLAADMLRHLLASGCRRARSWSSPSGLSMHTMLRTCLSLSQTSGALARSRSPGDPAGARRAYQDAFAIWKDADPDVPILVAARKEYDGLR
jgi:hypothetical protein